MNSDLITLLGTSLYFLAVNLILMLSSTWISGFLNRFHVIGPLIRIMGLIVAAVAVQLILGGIGDWYAVIK